jgi:P27 family predicted phage terminase small subunit
MRKVKKSKAAGDKPEVGKLSGIPSPPAWLSKDAREVWVSTCRYLLDRETLHSGDLFVVEAFASAVARARAFQAVLDEQGYVTEAGKINPVARMIEAVVGTIRANAGVLGLAPMARQRMSAEVRN